MWPLDGSRKSTTVCWLCLAALRTTAAALIECYQPDTASELANAIRPLEVTRGRLRLCLNDTSDEVFRVSSLLKPLEIPAGSIVHLHCGGRAINFFHPAGHVYMGDDSVLELERCNVTSLYGDGTTARAASTASASFFVGSASAQVVLIHSAARHFLDAATLVNWVDAANAHQNPGSHNIHDHHLDLKVDRMLYTTTGSWAAMLTKASLTYQRISEVVLIYQNTVAWCADTWDQSSSLARAVRDQEATATPIDRQARGLPSSVGAGEMVLVAGDFASHPHDHTDVSAREAATERIGELSGSCKVCCTSLGIEHLPTPAEQARLGGSSAIRPDDHSHSHGVTNWLVPSCVAVVLLTVFVAAFLLCKHRRKSNTTVSSVKSSTNNNSSLGESVISNPSHGEVTAAIPPNVPSLLAAHHGHTYDHDHDPHLCIVCASGGAGVGRQLSGSRLVGGLKPMHSSHSHTSATTGRSCPEGRNSLQLESRTDQGGTGEAGGGVWGPQSSDARMTDGHLQDDGFVGVPAAVNANESYAVQLETTVDAQAAALAEDVEWPRCKHAHHGANCQVCGMIRSDRELAFRTFPSFRNLLKALPVSMQRHSAQSTAQQQPQGKSTEIQLRSTGAEISGHRSASWTAGSSSRKGHQLTPAPIGTPVVPHGRTQDGLESVRQSLSFSAAQGLRVAHATLQAEQEVGTVTNTTAGSTPDLRAVRGSATSSSHPEHSQNSLPTFLVATAPTGAPANTYVPADPPQMHAAGLQHSHKYYHPDRQAAPAGNSIRGIWTTAPSGAYPALEPDSCHTCGASMRRGSSNAHTGSTRTGEMRTIAMVDGVLSMLEAREGGGAGSGDLVPAGQSTSQFRSVPEGFQVSQLFKAHEPDRRRSDGVPQATCRQVGDNGPHKHRYASGYNQQFRPFSTLPNYCLHGSNAHMVAAFGGGAPRDRGLIGDEVEVGGVPNRRRSQEEVAQGVARWVMSTMEAQQAEDPEGPGFASAWSTMRADLEGSGSASGSLLPAPPTHVLAALSDLSTSTEPSMSQVLGNGGTGTAQMPSATKASGNAVAAGGHLVRGSAGPRGSSGAGTDVGAGKRKAADSPGSTDTVDADAADAVGGVAPEAVPQAISQAVARMRTELELQEVPDPQFRIHSVLGRGGFGTVYRGEWRSLCVAIKVLIFHSDQAKVAEVASEAAIATNLSHHNLVATYSHDIHCLERENAGIATFPAEPKIFKLYLIQEYCNGGSLREAIQRGLFGARRVANRFTALMTILCHVADGLQYMHAKRICHGDLNPSNILLKYDESAYKSLDDALQACAVSAKIADFGMATRLQAEQSHASGVTCGTLFYMAPEVREQHKLHPESDTYSFGVMMWELMMGCLAYYSPAQNEAQDGSGDGKQDGSKAGGNNLHRNNRVLLLHPWFLQLPPGTPRTFQLTMQVCLSKKPEDRLGFEQLSQLMRCVLEEVSKGAYMDSHNRQQDSLVLDIMPLNVNPQVPFSDLPAHPPMDQHVPAPTPGAPAVTGSVLESCDQDDSVMPSSSSATHTPVATPVHGLASQQARPPMQQYSAQRSMPAGGAGAVAATSGGEAASQPMPARVTRHVYHHPSVVRYSTVLHPYPLNMPVPQDVGTSTALTSGQYDSDSTYITSATGTASMMPVSGQSLSQMRDVIGAVPGQSQRETLAPAAHLRLTHGGGQPASPVTAPEAARTGGTNDQATAAAAAVPSPPAALVPIHSHLTDSAAVPLSETPSLIPAAPSPPHTQAAIAAYRAVNPGTVGSSGITSGIMADPCDPLTTRDAGSSTLPATATDSRSRSNSGDGTPPTAPRFNPADSRPRRASLDTQLQHRNLPARPVFAEDGSAPHSAPDMKVQALSVGSDDCMATSAQLPNGVATGGDSSPLPAPMALAALSRLYNPYVVDSSNQQGAGEAAVPVSLPVAQDRGTVALPLKRLTFSAAVPVSLQTARERPKPPALGAEEVKAGASQAEQCAAHSAGHHADDGDDPTAQHARSMSMPSPALARMAIDTGTTIVSSCGGEPGNDPEPSSSPPIAAVQSSVGLSARRDSTGAQNGAQPVTGEVSSSFQSAPGRRFIEASGSLSYMLEGTPCSARSKSAQRPKSAGGRLGGQRRRAGAHAGGHSLHERLVPPSATSPHAPPAALFSSVDGVSSIMGSAAASAPFSSQTLVLAPQAAQAAATGHMHAVRAARHSGASPAHRSSKAASATLLGSAKDMSVESAGSGCSPESCPALVTSSPRHHRIIIASPVKSPRESKSGGLRGVKSAHVRDQAPRRQARLPELETTGTTRGSASTCATKASVDSHVNVKQQRASDMSVHAWDV